MNLMMYQMFIITQVNEDILAISFFFSYNRNMKTNHNILWVIAGIYIFIIWFYLLITFVVFESQTLLPLIGLAGIILTTIFPLYFWIRQTLLKIKKLYEQHRFKEIIDFVKQKPSIVFQQDLENIYLFLAISYWSLKDEDQFQNHLKLITSPRLLAIRDMWIVIDYLVNHQVYDAEEYFKNHLGNVDMVKPIRLRKALPIRIKNMIDLAKNKSNKEMYLEIFRQASNPRVIEYLNEFEEDYMV